jgi:thiamine biosynthesis lipoprotein
MERSTFQAMGGTTEVLAIDVPAAGDNVCRLFHDYEQRLSRFLPWSELSSLNRSAGTGGAFAASRELFDAVQLSLAWAGRTDGIFDPTILADLQACGYDRPFEELGDGNSPTAVKGRPPRVRWRDIGLRPADRSIALPAGTRLDLGGIGKGYTVDAAFRCLPPAANAVVNASGDLFASGCGPEGGGWVIGVEDPERPGEDIAALRVKDRGIATSGSCRRFWSIGGRRYHHLIDARSGLPYGSDVLQATIIATDATTADVLAKTAYFAGARHALALSDRYGVGCLLVRRDGHLELNELMQEYLI